jgi:hypothetical protein
MAIGTQVVFQAFFSAPVKEKCLGTIEGVAADGRYRVKCHNMTLICLVAQADILEVR